jgi:hypothetical protein
MPNSGQSGARSAGDKRASTDGARTPDDQVRALYEQMESNTARAFDEFVSKPSFGSAMARSAENVAALTRIASDFADLVLRNMRVAGRADITRLARQLQRTEDKLERVLQEVEELRDDLGERPGSRRANGRDPKAGERAKADR